MLGELITQIGGIAVAIIAAWQTIRVEKVRKESKRKDVQLRESSRNLAALSLLVDFELTSAVSYKIEQVFEQTSIDRFLLIIAVNGRSDFSTVSVVFEKFKNRDTANRIDAIDAYSHVRIDHHYKELLKNVEALGLVKLVTDSMPEDSMLYSIYQNEGVKASHVYPVTRMKVDENNDMLLFCSYAARGVMIGVKDSAFIRMIHGGIQNAFSEYEKKISEYSKRLDNE